MGNKSFKETKFKSLCVEVASRIKRKRNLDQNTLFEEKKKIAESVKNKDEESALIRIDSIINTEEHILALDILVTLIDQLRNKYKQIGSYGVTEDLKECANGVVYASKRLDIKEIETLSNMLKSVMKKSEYLEAQNGSCDNKTIKEKLEIRTVCNAEKWLKLIEICENSGVELKVKKRIKGEINEYCYRQNIENPLDKPIKEEAKIAEVVPTISIPQSDKSKIKSSKTEIKDEKKDSKKSKKKKSDKKEKKKKNKSQDGDDNGSDDNGSDNNQDLLGYKVIVYFIFIRKTQEFK